MSPVEPSKRPSLANTAGDHEKRIRQLERRPPGTWVYVGDYPTDPGTTPDSPPFENGWFNVGDGLQRLRFRRTNENQLEVHGNITPGTSSLDGTVVTTMNDAIYIPQEEGEAIGLVDGAPARWTLRTNGELVYEGPACCGDPPPPTDITASEVIFDPTTDIPEDNVQSAIVEVKQEILDHISDPVGAHDATAIFFTGSTDVPRDNVQDAIDYLASIAGGVIFGTPAVVLGTVAAAGSIDEAIRRNATIVAFDGTAPTTQAFGDAAATGSAAVAARRDHKHAMPANPLTETSGPTVLAFGAVANGEYLTRSGSSIIGGSPTPGGPPTGAAGGDLSGTYPNPKVAKITETSGPTDLTIGTVVDGEYLKRVGSTLVSAAPVAVGSSALVYRYTVTGSDKASIDTGVDTPDAGSNDWTNGDLLEIFIVARTDEAVVISLYDLIFNNDVTAVYDRLNVQMTNTTIAGQNVGASPENACRLNGAGATAGTSIFSSQTFRVPNYAGTTAFKVLDSIEVMPDNTAGNNRTLLGGFGYRSTSAITRAKIIPETAAKKFKVGTQILIYKRLAS